MTAPPPYFPPAPQPAPRKSRLPLILGIVVSVLVLCCGGGATFMVVASREGGPLSGLRLPAPGGEPASPRPTTPEAAPPVTEPSSAPPTTTAPTGPPPADVTYSGRGNKVVELKPQTGEFSHFAVISHRGSSNFAIWSVGSDGEEKRLIVNDVGSYQGSRPLDLDDTPAALKVEADGSWKIVVKVMDKAPRWPRVTSGKGPQVLRVTGPAKAKVTHRGSSNFVVHSYGDYPDLLVNEIGKYSGEIDLPAGTTVVAIEGDGSWTMKPS
ncbi:hypothetical protein AB0M54_05550 [Actinoplanes sp. NPDC051470]|uniref:hypothetical protein n=1 Tax=Actinoplanes sp. NPDC051470 TaxID=3157224 RepID=UPI0034408284